MLINTLKVTLFLMAILVFRENTFAQTETKDFEQQKFKLFSSKGHIKNRGLNFTIKYPVSYSAKEVKNENVVKGFAHKTYNLIYMVGVIKSPTLISSDDENIILSEENLKKSLTTISNSNQTFFGYQNNLTINGMNSAYLEYLTNVTNDTKSYIRQYFIIYKNYLLTISFTVPQQPNMTLEFAKTRFDNYKTFFDVAAKTLTILK